MTERQVHPTQEQQAVIDTDKQILVVTASAGAGKTGTLVLRYVAAVEQGIRPRHILAVTFTRKAAAEIKERIIKALHDKGLTDMAQEAEGSPIMTIDAFCDRLLRENALEAEVDPEFTPLSAAEASVWREEAMGVAFREDWSSSPHVEAFLANPPIVDAAPPWLRFNKSLMDVLHIREGTVTRDEVIEAYATPERVLERWRQMALAGVDPDVASKLEDVPVNELIPTLSVILREAKVRAPTWVRGGPVNLTQEAEQTSALVLLAARVWRSLEERMELEQRFDLRSVSSRAIRLLERNAAVNDALKGRFKQAIVDEVQDLNPQQHRLIELLPSDTKLLIGDPQQTIFAFRDAEPKLFDDMVRRLPVARLTQNFRSEIGLLNFVNDVFSAVWGAEYSKMVGGSTQEATTGYAGVEYLAGTISTPQLGDLVENAMRSNNAEPRDVAVLFRTNSEALSLHYELRSRGIPSKPPQGEEPFYTRLEVRDMANILRALDDPHDHFSLAAVLRGPSLRISLAGFHALCMGGRPWVAMRNPVCLSDEDGEKVRRFLDWFEPISRDAPRLPAWEVIGRVLAESPLLANLAADPEYRRLLINTRNLLWLAMRQPECGPKEFAEQVAEVQKLNDRHANPSSSEIVQNAVTLGTVHSAKGLEWPIVVLDCRGREPKMSRCRVVVRRRDALVATSFAPHPPNPFRDLLAAEHHKREKDESMRLLYVGMTRARKRLCLVMGPESQGGWSKTIRDAVSIRTAERNGAMVSAQQ